MIQAEDIQYIRQAMQLAQCGEGAVNPNPLVGALIVRDGIVIAQGYHARYGELHAERNAFKHADEERIDCSGATMYVTLEPCCHYGKQPPCTEAIIAHRIHRVVVGLLDPNPLVAGHGIEILRNAGVVVDVVEDSSPIALELKEQNRVFLHYITQHRPWIVMKYAMSLDGKICTHTGDSQWISGQESRALVHKLRKRYSAILCGIGTVLADNPMLNTRIDDDPDARNPIRIILDHQARIPLDSKLVQTAQDIQTIVVHDDSACEEKLSALRERGVITWNCSTLNDLLNKTAEQKIDSILIEGGGTINEAFASQHLINELYAFVAPKIIGGVEAKTPVEGKGFARLCEVMQLENISSQKLGEDIFIHGYCKNKN